MFVVVLTRNVFGGSCSFMQHHNHSISYVTINKDLTNDMPIKTNVKGLDSPYTK